jgi:hypothetical protein
VEEEEQQQETTSQETQDQKTGAKDTAGQHIKIKPKVIIPPRDIKKITQ